MTSVKRLIEEIEIAVEQCIERDFSGATPSEVAKAVIAAISPPGDYVQAIAETRCLRRDIAAVRESLAKECREAQANAREAILQRDRERAEREQDRIAWVAASDRNAAEIARLTSDLDRSQKSLRVALGQRDAANAIAEAREASLRREQTALALGYAERASVNLGDAIAALRKEIGS